MSSPILTLKTGSSLDITLKIVSSLKFTHKTGSSIDITLKIVSSLKFTFKTGSSLDIQGFRSCRFCRFARFFKNLLKSLQYPLKSMQNMQMTPCTSKTLISNESNSVHRSKNFRNVLLWVSGSHTTIFGSNGWKFRKQMSKHRNEVFGKNLFLGQKIQTFTIKK